MRTEERRGGPERQVLISCVSSTPFLSRVVGRIGKEPFRSRWSNLLWKWCSRHFHKYQEAPGRAIEQIYEEWAKENKDNEIGSLIDRFLSGLSSEHERNGEVSVDFLIDQAEQHFRKVQIERLREQLEAGTVEQGMAAIDSFPRINLHCPPRIDVLRDRAVQKQALEQQQQVLIEYDGAAGEFFGDELSRDSFIGIMAQAKGGKSYTLLDIAWRGMEQGKKVAYFQVGDLSRDQIMRRFQRRAAQRPIKAISIRFPISIVLGSGYRDLAVVAYEERDFPEKINWQEARKAYRQIAKRCDGGISLSYHPICTVSVADIKSVLEGWDREGFVADVVIIDYAGNLAPVDYKMSPVDQVSQTWALLRQLSEVRKCLVVTAQQSNKEGFSSWVLTRKHFSSSKMILAHVTGFLGVNMTDEEKGRGIIRYNWVLRREGQFTESYCLYAASCLEVANPMVVTCLPAR